MEKVRWKQNSIAGLRSAVIIAGTHKHILVKYKGRLLRSAPVHNVVDVRFRLVNFNPKNYGEDMDYRIDLVAAKFAKVGLTVLDRSDFLNPACHFGGKQLVSFFKP
jgi:hypothetical protein